MTITSAAMRKTTWQPHTVSQHFSRLHDQNAKYAHFADGLRELLSAIAF